MLRWVCRDEVAYLDLATDRLELSPAPGRGVATADDVKHRALAEVLDSRVKTLVQAGVSWAASLCKAAGADRPRHRIG